MLRIHPRELVVRDAERALRDAVNTILWKKFELTTSEILSVLASVLAGEIASITKLCIREERHGDLNKPGGVE